MNKINYIKAFEELEKGKIIQSMISDLKFKKYREDYYYNNWRNDKGWIMCKLDEGLFTSGEIQGGWYLVENTYSLNDELILLKSYEVIVSKNENEECKFVFMKNDTFKIIDIKNEWYKLESKRGIFMFQKEILEEYFNKIN